MGHAVIADIAQLHIHNKDVSNSSAQSFMANERDSAIRDLLKESHFRPQGDERSPYAVNLSIQDNRLVFALKNSNDEELPSLVLSLNPYRRIMRDYFLMIQSYQDLRAAANQTKLEAVDMGRRGLHNEAAELLQTRLENKIIMDLDTARRIFTLICYLQTESKIWR